MRVEPQPFEPYVVLSRRLYPPRHRVLRGIPGAFPFLNVILLIVFYVILQMPFVLQPGVTVDLPRAPFTQGVPYGRLVLTLTQEGLLMFRDEVLSPGELGIRLREAAAAAPEDALVIEADAGVPNSQLAAIFSLARRAGITRVVLASRPE